MIAKRAAFQVFGRDRDVLFIQHLGWCSREGQRIFPVTCPFALAGDLVTVVAEEGLDQGWHTQLGRPKNTNMSPDTGAFIAAVPIDYAAADAGTIFLTDLGRRCDAGELVGMTVGVITSPETRRQAGSLVHHIDEPFQTNNVVSLKVDKHAELSLEASIVVTDRKPGRGGRQARVAERVINPGGKTFKESLDFLTEADLSLHWKTIDSS